MRVLEYAEARYQARQVQSAIIVGDGWITNQDGVQQRFITVRPFADLEADPKAASDTLSEIIDKLKPLGWMNLEGCSGVAPGTWGRPVLM